MLVRKANVMPIECIVRGYLDGSVGRVHGSGLGPALVPR